jgi:hypothetical protein
MLQIHERIVKKVKRGVGISAVIVVQTAFPVPCVHAQYSIYTENENLVTLLKKDLSSEDIIKMFSREPPAILALQQCFATDVKRASESLVTVTNAAIFRGDVSAILKSLQNAPRLGKLGIRFNDTQPVSVKDAEIIENMKALADIHIHSKMGHEAGARLKSRSIKKLYLEYADDLKWLTLPNLEELTVGSSMPADEVGQLGKFQALRRLTFQDLSDEVIRALPLFPAIQFIGWIGDDPTVEGLSKLPQRLAEIHLKYVDEGRIRALERFSQLRRLHVYQGGAKSQTMKKLANLKLDSLLINKARLADDDILFIMGKMPECHVMVFNDEECRLIEHSKEDGLKIKYYSKGCLGSELPGYHTDIDKELIRRWARKRADEQGLMEMSGGGVQRDNICVTNDLGGAGSIRTY